MLESAEIGHRIAKEDYLREEPKLRDALLNAQWDLNPSGRGPVLLVISGVEAGGRGETANKLTARMAAIRRHERMVTDGGAVVVKFWLQISATEQLRRFRERETTSFKLKRLEAAIG